MTIKPLSAPTTKRVAANTDVENKNKENHSVVGVGVGQVVGESAVVNQGHRNVIDGHGQSPQRRGEVYDELTRTHRCSPHKSSRSKRRDHHDLHLHHKRERVERGVVNSDKLCVGNTGVAVKCGSPHLASSVTAAASVASGANSPVLGGNKSPDRNATQIANVSNLKQAVEEFYSGYNSGDEHLQSKEAEKSVEEWQQRDEKFAKSVKKRGYELKLVEEDGACLFRSIALQIYGDEGMHDIIRQQTMDYIYKNREYYSQFLTEDINGYIKRKRRNDSHGNHIEIQAISEIYSRPIEVYCYELTPINIFNSEQSKNGYPPLRLSYQRGSHYNAILDPYNATVGVGLGLAGYKPEYQTKEAVRLSEQLEIEQTMFEDKLKTTDWEATNEVIEEQIARESYLQWCRENIQRSRANMSTTSSTSATVTSAEAACADNVASPSKYSLIDCDSSSVSAAAGSADITEATTISNNSSCLNTANVATLGSGLSSKSSLFIPLSPKSLNQQTHSKKKDVNELGYESDATDMSSTSSVSFCGSGSMSPTVCSKKVKARRNGCSNTLRRTGKKRHNERPAATNRINKDKGAENLDVSPHKSPKHENFDNSSEQLCTKRVTSDVEQQPCTSKQSNTPEKCFNENEASTSNGMATPTSTSNKISSFYQELLEASYAADGFNESEMLQRALQMSTQDYIEDQKRKYLYGP